MTSPRHLLAAADLHAKKQLGQHFLREPNTAARIAELSGVGPGSVVLEIGAGLGALTLQLATRCAMVYAVEKDTDLIQLLRVELLARNLTNVEIIPADILKVDLAALARRAGQRLIVAGNLPYNISSQIIIQLIGARASLQRAVVMLQKELAVRLPAPPGARDYGRLSVMLQYVAAVRALMDIGAHQFFPAPKIDSSVIEISFHATPPRPAQDEALLFKTIKAAFGKRRKTLKNALHNSDLGLSDTDAAMVLADAAIDPRRRAETLGVAEFVQLSNILARRCGAIVRVEAGSERLSG